MNKICLIFNTPSLYRKLIYTRIDQEFNCDWYFGDWDANVKSFDTSCLKHPVHYLHVNHPGKALYSVDGVVSLLKDKRYDRYLMIGDAHDLSTWRILLLKYLFYRKKRIYFWTHGWYGKESKMERLIKYFFYKMVDGVFLYGNYAKELMIKEGISSSKLYVLHNSLDYSKQLAIRKELKSKPIYQDHFGNNNQTIILICRLNPRKRIDMLIEALSVLKSKGWLYNLVIVGDGSEKGNLQSMAEQYGVNNQIWFYGACYDEQTNAELIYNADLCVTPGDIGLTAIHVMMFGVPVLTHDNYPHQGPEFETIHEGVTGSFYKYSSVGSLSECIVSWFSNHKDDREIVRQACFREIDTQWTPDFQMQVIKSVIEQK